MKTIGLIGGLGWESSLEYYRIINLAVQDRCGGMHSAQCILYSLDGAMVYRLQEAGDWSGLTIVMTAAASGLKKAGADNVLICCNTLHVLADAIQEQVGLEVLHIADATGEKIRQENLKTVGLLGTRFTMEQDFYRKRLMKKFNIGTIVPCETDRRIIDDIIFQELTVHKRSQESRERVIRIIGDLADRGAEGIILGCTELPFLIGQDAAAVPVFDTLTIHAMAAVEYAMG